MSAPLPACFRAGLGFEGQTATNAFRHVLSCPVLPKATNRDNVAFCRCPSLITRSTTSHSVPRRPWRLEGLRELVRSAFDETDRHA